MSRCVTIRMCTVSTVAHSFIQKINVRFVVGSRKKADRNVTNQFISSRKFQNSPTVFERLPNQQNPKNDNCSKQKVIFNGQLCAVQFQRFQLHEHTRIPQFLLSYSAGHKCGLTLKNWRLTKSANCRQTVLLYHNYLIVKTLEEQVLFTTLKQKTLGFVFSIIIVLGYGFG